ncbi:MAG TPA: hypothetical protein ENG62_01420 [Thermoplasmatales archaeon]|nr:hypothetical protein [Thermoplasmatales archaeon]
MGKNRDLIQILLIVILGMFIPFLGSIVITFNLDPLKTEDLFKITITFGYFLLIFGIELLVVYIYFRVTNTLAQRILDKQQEEEIKNRFQ